MLSRALLLVCGLVALLSAAPLAQADCLVQSEQKAVSANGAFKATLDADGALKVWRKDAKTKKFVRHGGGRLTLRGHHFNLVVANTGDRVVVYDIWEGIGVYRTDGSVIQYHAGTTLLTAEERENAPDKWSCHPEGALLDAVTLTPDGTVAVKVHTGRRIDLRLRDGIVLAGLPNLSE